MELIKLPLPKSQALAEDYMHRFEKVRAWYEYEPFAETSWRGRAGWLDRSEGKRADRSAVAKRLRAFNEKAGNRPEAFRQIDRLENGALAVIGGQQAGLLTGPMLVIHKAITIIKAAREAEQRLGRPVVPVFWIAGEDHDFDEVNHVHVGASSGSLRKVELPRRDDRRLSVSRRLIDERDWEEAMDAFACSLSDGPLKPELVERLRAVLRSSRTLVDQFAAIMAWWFGEYGLVLLDSDDPGIRSLEGAFFHRILQESSGLSDAYVAATMEIEEAGYAPQAEVAAESANLFLYVEDERVMLYRDRKESGVFSDRAGQRKWTADELAERCERAPESFSNNVLTRPLMQDYLFPVLASVLGGGEISYWAQTSKAFARLGGQMPIILPRLEFTLAEEGVVKHLAKFGMELPDVFRSFRDKKRQWLEAQDDYRLKDRFDAVKRQFDELYEPLLALAAEINPGLGPLGETNRRKIADQIAFMEARTMKALEDKHETSLRQLERIRLGLIPQDRLQERVYNGFEYINRHGFDWIRELLDQPLPANADHHVVFL